MYNLVQFSQQNIKIKIKPIYRNFRSSEPKPIEPVIEPNRTELASSIWFNWFFGIIFYPYAR